MVQVASAARALNITAENMLKHVLREKIRGYYRGCSASDQIDYVEGQYDGIEKELVVSDGKQAITDDDILVGFQMFWALHNCEREVEREKLYKFLHDLVSFESPKTIIQATVNTMQAKNIKEVGNRARLIQFFHSLDSFFQFNIGKILLATSSLEDVRNMIDEDWPYFTNYLAEVKQCIDGTSCRGVKDLVQTLGK
jgi:hypothetical protein